MQNKGKFEHFEVFEAFKKGAFRGVLFSKKMEKNRGPQMDQIRKWNEKMALKETNRKMKWKRKQGKKWNENLVKEQNGKWNEKNA